MSNNITLFCSNEDELSKRLDVFLSENIENLSRSAAQKLISDGSVLVNNAEPLKNYKLKLNDKIEISIPQQTNSEPLAKEIPLDIVYEDDCVIIVNKPKGMVVHPGAGKEQDTLVNALLYRYGKDNLSDLNGAERPGIVHRIDRDTSGLLVCAKNNEAHAFLSQQFAEHTIERTYYAICHGHLKEKSGTIDAPLGRHPTDRKKYCITEKNARRAVTHYEVLEEYNLFSLLKLNLETGRTHQIRVHMASINHPVAGDEIYGPKKGIKLNGQCLHAKTLGFMHPETKAFVSFSSPLPPYFESLIAKLRGAYK